MGRFQRWEFLISVICVVLYLGVSCASTVLENRSKIAGEAPDKMVAPYALRLQSTGQVIFARSATQTGSTVGQREFTIQDWWGLRKDKFMLHKGTMTLKEKYFGPIDLTRR